MNPYFWLFSLYAFLITPIRVHVSVRIGKGVWYRVRLQAAGLPFVRKTDAPEAEEPVQQEDVARTLSGWQPFVQLVREGEVQKALRVIHMETLYVHARFSFNDAALTALCYAGLHTLLRTLFHCGLSPRALSGRVEADFDGRGTQLFVRSIISARLGSLVPAAIRLWTAYAKHARLKEETYAAASH